MLRHVTYAELRAIISNHDLWLNDKNTGERADLSYADLDSVDLYSMNLSKADLHGANLCSALLDYANLREADLREANLSEADLVNADLSNADLSNANLCDADLSGAKLIDAKFEHALLFGTRLLGTAGFKDDSFIAASLMACPEKGSFIGWKKVIDDDGTEYIIELLIPEDAKRSSATTRKCRCSYAIVQSITRNDDTQKEIQSIMNTNFFENTLYTVGKPVYPDSFDENRWDECSNGIHFFITRAEAVNYKLRTRI